MKIFKQIITSCLSVLFFIVAPVSAVLPASKVEVIEDDMPSKGHGEHPLWLFLSLGFLLVIWADVDASGGEEFFSRIWTERLLILFLLIRMHILERRVLKLSHKEDKSRDVTN